MLCWRLETDYYRSLRVPEVKQIDSGSFLCSDDWFGLFPGLVGEYG